MVNSDKWDKLAEWFEEAIIQFDCFHKQGSKQPPFFIESEC